MNNLNQLRPVKFLGLVSSDGSDDDDACERNETDVCQESSTSNLEQTL